MTIQDRLVKVIADLEEIAKKFAAKDDSGSAQTAINALSATLPFINALKDIVPSAAPAAPANEIPTEKKPEAEKKAEPKKTTKDDIGAAVRAAVATYGAEKVKKFIIDTFGVERASATPEDKWPEVIEKLKGIK